jgi:hypothetical protein
MTVRVLKNFTGSRIRPLKNRIQFEALTFIDYENIYKKGLFQTTIKNSVAEPHHFYAAPAPGKNFDAAPVPTAPAPAPTLLYSKAKF